MTAPAATRTRSRGRRSGDGNGPIVNIDSEEAAAALRAVNRKRRVEAMVEAARAEYAEELEAMRPKKRRRRAC